MMGVMDMDMGVARVGQGRGSKYGRREHTPLMLLVLILSWCLHCPSLEGYIVNDHLSQQ